MTVELVVCVRCAEASVVETSKGGNCGGCLEALVMPDVRRGDDNGPDANERDAGMVPGYEKVGPGLTISPRNL